MPPFDKTSFLYSLSSGGAHWGGGVRVSLSTQTSEALGGPRLYSHDLGSKGKKRL